VINTDRSCLGRVAGAIAKVHGDSGFAGTVALDLQGSGGQSFACFLVNGMVVRGGGVRVGDGVITGHEGMAQTGVEALRATYEGALNTALSLVSHT
jgi:glutamate synthase domain-containing protein 3